MSVAETSEAFIDAAPELDDLMLAMDVVDTLRHRQNIVEKELGSEARQDQLIKRLREIYKAQGIDVPDHILADGVKALEEQRFVYDPPANGLQVRLAKLYVLRAEWAKPLFLAVCLCLALWLVYHLAWVRPQEQRLAEQEIALTQTVPARLLELRDSVQGLTQDQTAIERARALYEDGQIALNERDLESARTYVSQLQALQDTLRAEFTLRIVARPGENSGIWRIPDDNPDAMNYYLIVEAIDANGSQVPMFITSEEDGSTRRVVKWGLRVNQSVFNTIRADKMDDGIIQDNKVGVKRRGNLIPEYTIETTGKAITRW